MKHNIISKNLYKKSEDSLESELFFILTKENNDIIKPLLNKEYSKVSKLNVKYFTGKKTVFLGEFSDEMKKNLDSDRMIIEHRYLDEIWGIVSFTNYQYPLVVNNKYETDDFYGSILLHDIQTFDVLLKLNVRIENVSKESIKDMDIAIGDFHTFVCSDSTNALFDLIPNKDLHSFLSQYNQEITDSIMYQINGHHVRKNIVTKEN